MCDDLDIVLCVRDSKRQTRYGITNVAERARRLARQLRCRVPQIKRSSRHVLPDLPSGIRTPAIATYFERVPEAERASVATHAMRRLGEPDEIADAIVYLCSIQKED